MATDAHQLDADVGQWWFLFGVALFLLVPLDLFTTLLAVEAHGIGVEANPIMRWLFGHGLLAVMVVNLAIVGLAASLFHAALGRLRHSHPPYRRALTHVVNVWLGALLVTGVALVTNNLLVLV